MNVLRHCACALTLLGSALGVSSVHADPGTLGGAEASSAAVPPGPHATVEWVLDSQLVPGTVARSAVFFRIEDGWHIYGNAKNDTGFPARFTPAFPPGIELVAEVWPAPSRHVSPGGILDHVYEGETAVFLDLRVAADAPIGEAELGLAVDWLVCREACVFESDSLAVRWNVSSPLALVSTASSHLRTGTHAARIPRPLSPEAGVVIERLVHADGTPLARISATGAKGLTFIPALDGAVLVDALADATTSGDRLDLRLEDGSLELAGVLEVQRAGTTEWFHVP